MGKLFCFFASCRKTKVINATSDRGMVRKSKDMGNERGSVPSDDSFNMKLAKPGNEVELVIDIDSVSACSETACSKQAGSEQTSTLFEKLQPTDFATDNGSPCPDLKVNLHHHCTVGGELLAVLEEPIGNHSGLSWSLHSRRTLVDEVSVSVNEVASGSGDESRGFFLQHSGRLCADSQSECADESEDGCEVSDLESNRLSPSHEDLSPDAHPTEYLENSDQYLHLAGSYFEDHAEHERVDKRLSIYEYAKRRAGFLDSPCTATSASNKSDRMVSDDEVLTGHLSDPGVYNREELRSTSDSSILLNRSSLVPISNAEMQSHVSGSATSGNAVENVSVQIDEHGNYPLDFTFHSADKVLLRPEFSSEFTALSMPKSSLKVFLASHRDIDHKAFHRASDAVPLRVRTVKKLPSTMVGSHIFQVGHPFGQVGMVLEDCTAIEGVNHVKAISTDQHSEVVEESGMPVFESRLRTISGKSILSSNEQISFPFSVSALTRVEEWISDLQHPADGEEILPEVLDASALNKRELSNEICVTEVGEASSAMHQATGIMTNDAELASAALRSVNIFSTVAHMSGIGLREVPALGLFNNLKTLNLSANSIARVPAGCLPRSLHSLDLSRNRIALIEGLRDLTRLRVLNLSDNRLSRIGHGLASCTLIRELYLADNKIADVEGLHRLLKLTVLDLSFNKLTTSKALGQLAANYSSLLALNLLGNPVLTNVGEEQLRKLVMSLTRHVIYLNKKPIKAVSARETVVDSVARAALGTSQRNSKPSGSKASRRLSGAQPASLQKKSSSHRSKDSGKKHGSISSVSEVSKSARVYGQPIHSHRHHHNTEKSVPKEHSRTPMFVNEHPRNHVVDTGIEGMHRSRSDSALQD